MRSTVAMYIGSEQSTTPSSASSSRLESTLSPSKVLVKLFIDFDQAASRMRFPMSRSRRPPGGNSGGGRLGCGGEPQVAVDAIAGLQAHWRRGGQVLDEAQVTLHRA